jgi:hypothetical protein
MQDTVRALGRAIPKAQVHSLEAQTHAVESDVLAPVLVEFYGGTMSTKSTQGFPKGIGAPATRALTSAGYSDLSQLADVTVADLKNLHGMGPRALRVIQEALAERGLSLRHRQSDR